jgi:hypothetical protein
MLLFVSSLALLLSTIGFCIRGHWADDWFQWHRTDEAKRTWTGLDVVPCRSGVYVSYQFFRFERDGEALKYATRLERVSGVRHVTSHATGNPYSGSFWDRLGFGFVLDGPNDDYGSEGPYRYWFNHGHVPYWFLLMLFALGAAPGALGILRRRRTARRVSANQCVKCGYDLRATPDRCPECGTAR